MNTVSIRRYRKVLLPVLFLFGIVLMWVAKQVFFSVIFENNLASFVTKLWFVIFVIFILYKSYWPILKTLKNEPILIFSDEGLEINTGQSPIFFAWKHIKSWQFESDEGETDLIIKTTESNEKVNITYLEKSADDIENLLKTYKKDAALRELF